MNRTNIYLTEEQTAALDRLAAQEGTSRAMVIRRLLDRALAGDDQDLSADLAAIEASFGASRDIDALSRDSGERENHLASLWERSA
ncbi:ribbon-helix-helix protein, CopG family [Jiangella ureilytica]|uniref:Ribbon-helix-helix protein, CopG family n=1 Tax=Jiangella ureilytica TaxID=2530374 RepID=A0A4R4RCG9_9ACTN|nr:CopG family transcriptional regulator [Jiangella ureilytica]TDC46820.1 ribbon-helix-helix protein, CopG family [Jiangella ureilytica]